jgi:hypothetical protein
MNVEKEGAKSISGFCPSKEGRKTVWPCGKSIGSTSR